MDINLFLKSLSPTELRDMKKAFIGHLEQRITTKEFINKNKMSTRLLNILTDNSHSDAIFEYVDQINKMQFLRLRNAGISTWVELEKLIKKAK